MSRLSCSCILMARFNPIYILFLLLLVASSSKSQSVARFSTSSSLHHETIVLTPSDTSYRLERRLIIEGSEEILLDSLYVLSPFTDYTLDRREGILLLHPLFLARIVSDSVAHVLFIRYRTLPLSFLRQYSLREMITLNDSAEQDPFVTASPSSFRVDDLFGPDLQKSGSIVRGLTVGSNRDLSLNSGFRMQVSGALSSDIDIAAALTDENSPIQPEGTTQTLQELDQVFVELTGKRFSVTLGDFQIRVGREEGGEFGRLFRKLQGAKGKAMFENQGSLASEGGVTVVGATSRGKFTTNQFQGLEGNQGPYRLTSKEGGRSMIVLAGTERVYLNGELMTRGEVQDYTIDYAGAEVTFTARRIITNASRIVVDFEYSDRQFSRNLLGASVETKSFSDRLRWNFNIVQEADDPDASIDLPLDDATRKQLRLSGADRFAASVSGVRFAGRDSVSQAASGQYILRDTIIAGRTYTILHYAPGNPLSLYSASFANVDRVPADSAGYTRVGVGHFEFAGIGKGNYLPLRFLPIPQLHRVMSSHLQAKVTTDLMVEGEFALSNLDRNRLSDLDNGQNQGGAYNLLLRYEPKELALAGVNIGSLSLSLAQRHVAHQFAALDRSNEVEYDRKWDLTSLLVSDETTREAGFRYVPLRGLTLGGTYGLLNRAGVFESNRLSAELAYHDSASPRLEYSVEQINSRQVERDEEARWTRQRGILQYRMDFMVPTFRIESEERKQETAPTDSLAAGSFRFVEIAPSVTLSQLGPMHLSAELQIRMEDSSAAGTLQRAFRSLTQMYAWQLREWESLSSSLSFNIRKAEFTEAFRGRGNVDSDVILVRSQIRYSPLQRSMDADLLYELSNQRSSRLERVFVRVPRGTGNYLYKGDQNGNGIADDDEFEPTRFEGDYIALFVPGDRLEPVVDLKTGLRLRIQPARVLARGEGMLGDILRIFSTETTVRVEERSTEPDTRKIYFLNFNRFQNDLTTIAGSSLLIQDLYVFENDPALSFRFRFRERRGLLKLVGGNERSLQIERSLRVRSQLLREIGNQTDITGSLDRVLASSSSIRARDIAGVSLQTEFSYRPEPQWEVALWFGLSRNEDRYAGENTTADINEQLVRVTYALPGSGQLRGELEREEAVLSNVLTFSNRALPYELTNGRVPGKTFLWNLAFDYRISQYVQVTMGYQGRIEGGRPAVHTARAEAKAFF